MIIQKYCRSCYTWSQVNNGRHFCPKCDQKYGTSVITVMAWLAALVAVAAFLGVKVL